MHNAHDNKTKQAKKLKKGDQVFVLGKFCRVTRVHSGFDASTIHLKTYTSTNPQRFTVIIDKNVRVRYRPQPKKK